MGKAGWLAAAAGLAMMAAAAPADAAARRQATKVTTRTAARAPVRRPTVRAAVQPVAAPAPAPPPLVTPAVADAPPITAYRWLDNADVMMAAIGDSPPDFAFEDARALNYAWGLGDGALVIVEPMPGGDARFYFYEAGATAPFLVRDRLYSFGYNEGGWSALYDAEGRTVWGRLDSWQGNLAFELAARGKRLLLAARRPLPLDWTRDGERTRAIAITLIGDFDRWREDDGRRAYRRGPGFDRWQANERHYARDRDTRAARTGGRRNDRWSGAFPADQGQGYTPGYARSAAGRPVSTPPPGRRAPPAGYAPWDDAGQPRSGRPATTQGSGGSMTWTRSNGRSTTTSRTWGTPPAGTLPGRRYETPPTAGYAPVAPAVSMPTAPAVSMPRARGGSATYPSGQAPRGYQVIQPAQPVAAAAPAPVAEAPGYVAPAAAPVADAAPRDGGRRERGERPTAASAAPADVAPPERAAPAPVREATPAPAPEPMREVAAPPAPEPVREAAAPPPPEPPRAAPPPPEPEPQPTPRPPSLADQKRASANPDDPPVENQ